MSRPRPEGPPRKLIVLRHAQSEYNAQGLWQGQLDSPLSELGREQARLAARALVHKEPVWVRASDLGRAADTGRIVAEACGAPFACDRALREIDAGDWAGRTSADVMSERPELVAMLHRGEDFRRGNTGETVAEVAARIVPAVREMLVELVPGQCGVVATHGVSARALIAEFIGLPQDLAWRAIGPLGNAHWAELVEFAEGWRLAAWNVSAEVDPVNRSIFGD